MKKIKEFKLKVKEFCYRHPILGWMGWLILGVVLIVELITGLTIYNSFKGTDGEVTEGLEDENSEEGTPEEVN